MDEIQICSYASRTCSLHFEPGWLHPAFRFKPCYWHVEQHGKKEKTTEPPLRIHPTSQHWAPWHSPSNKPEKPKHEAKASFVLLVVASYHKLIPLFGFGLLSCSGSFEEAVTSQICALQNRGISTLLRVKAEPFQQVTQILLPCGRSKSRQKKLIQHIRNKGYQNCQEKH